MTPTAIMQPKTSAASAHPRRKHQQLVDQAVMGCMRHDRRSLDAVFAASLVDARSSLGLSPLFAACYTLWPDAVHRLLAARADPFEVGLGSALDAVALGLRDAGRGVRATQQAARIVRLLRSYGATI